MQNKMFGDDFFGGGIEDLFNRLAGGSVGRNSVRSTGNTNLLSVTGDNKVRYFVFDLSGHKFNSVEIGDDLEVNEYGEEVGTGTKVLQIRFDGGSVMKYELPKELRKRHLGHTFKNGILEVVLAK